MTEQPNHRNFSTAVPRLPSLMHLAFALAAGISVSACQSTGGTSGTRAFQWANGEPAFDSTIGVKVVRGFRISPGGNIPVEATLNDKSIRANLGTGQFVTVADKPLYEMALKALATMEFCGTQVAPSFIARPMLNSVLRLAASSLGDEQGLIRKTHADQMKVPGACATYVSSVDKIPSSNIFIEAPRKVTPPGAAGRPS